MTKLEKVILGLQHCQRNSCNSCPYANDDGDSPYKTCGQIEMLGDALELLKEQQLSDQDRIDLDVIHRIRSRETVKVVKHDYIIVNGDWYREKGGIRVFPMLSEEALKELLAPEQPKEEDE